MTDGDRNIGNAPAAPGTPAREHVLLTVLGRAPKSACYRLEDREGPEASLAPLALYELLPESDRPDRVVALCTPEAEQESWPLLKTELDGRCRADPVPVPAGDDRQKIDDYIARAAEAIPDNADITVDVTHGYRHFAILTYMVVLYVSALRGVQVRGAWYGLLRRDEPSPFLDLRPLLELPRWLYGIRALNETGSARPMADLLGRNAAAKNAVRDLARASEAFLSGLPLELGRQASIVRSQRRKSLRKLISEERGLPLGESLVGLIDGFLSPFAFDRAPASGDKWKRQTPLTEHELARQARLIDRLLERGHVAVALRLMNEWTVSWVLWTRKQTEDWLDFNKVRRGAGNRLDALEAVGKDGKLKDRLNEEQRELGIYWGKLRDLRNGYAHHGMRPAVLVGDRHKQIEKALSHVRRYWEQTLRHRPPISVSLGKQPYRRVLVSPVGKRPGVLYSALLACRNEAGDPALLLAICSHATKAAIQDAADKAGYKGEIEPVLLDDPYGDVPAIGKQASKARPRFVGAEEVFVNVTGGTTLMGLTAEAMATAARKLACPVRRFGLIDRRPPDDQDARPWEAGEPFWIDDGKDGDADGA